eukprot:Opistho-2@80647
MPCSTTTEVLCMSSGWWHSVPQWMQTSLFLKLWPPHAMHAHMSSVDIASFALLPRELQYSTFTRAPSISSTLSDDSTKAVAVATSTNSTNAYPLETPDSRDLDTETLTGMMPSALIAARICLSDAPDGRPRKMTALFAKTGDGDRRPRDLDRSRALDLDRSDRDLERERERPRRESLLRGEGERRLHALSRDLSRGEASLYPPSTQRHTQ